MMRRNGVLAAIATIVMVIGVLCPLSAQAHPHVFATNQVVPIFDGEGLCGLRLTWHFDEMFGGMLLEDYDADGDRAFSAAEQAVLKSEAFDNLKNFHYFTLMTVAGEPVKVEDVESFECGVDAGEVYYSFVVPCRAAAGENVRVAVFDPEYYVDFYTPEDAAVHVDEGCPYAVAWKAGPNANLMFSTWLVTPTEVSLDITK